MQFLILPSPVTCYWELASFSWKSAGKCWQSKVLWWQTVPSHCMYTPTHTGLQLILHLMSDLTDFYTSYHFTSQAICTSGFSLSAHMQFMEKAMLGSSETCSGIPRIYQLLVMLSSLHNFVSKILNYLAALQLLIFFALLISISVKLTSWLALIPFVNINSPMYEQQHFQTLCSHFWQHSWQFGILCLGFGSAWSVST